MQWSEVLILLIIGLVALTWHFWGLLNEEKSKDETRHMDEIKQEVKTEVENSSLADLVARSNERYGGDPGTSGRDDGKARSSGSGGASTAAKGSDSKSE
jgi:hypothetical protein